MECILNDYVSSCTICALQGSTLPDGEAKKTNRPKHHKQEIYWFHSVVVSLGLTLPYLLDLEKAFSIEKRMSYVPTQTASSVVENIFTYV